MQDRKESFINALFFLSVLTAFVPFYVLDVPVWWAIIFDILCAMYTPLTGFIVIPLWLISAIRVLNHRSVIGPLPFFLCCAAYLVAYINFWIMNRRKN